MYKKFPKSFFKVFNFFKIIGRFFVKVEYFIKYSKVGKWIIRNNVLTLVPICFLTYQLFVIRAERDIALAEKSYYISRQETYYRGWDDIPFAMLEKIKLGDRYVFNGANTSAKDLFLKPMGLTISDILGKTDKEIEKFPNELIKHYYKIDSLVATSNKKYTVLEKQINYKIEEYYIVTSKWRRDRINKDTTIVLIAIPLDSINLDLLKSK